MTVNNLEKFAQRTKTQLAAIESLSERSAAAPGHDDDEESCRAFGYLRGVRERALSLEFRLANGNREAFPYNWLGPAQFNPSAGILLRFVGDLVHFVLIEGSNLNTLLDNAVSLYERGILRHRVTWVREMTRQEVQSTGEGEATVERIRIATLRPDDEPQGLEWLRTFRENA